MDEESSNQSFFWPLLNGKKKELKNERFSAPKIFSWGDLKEHLNNIFFKRGVIVMVVLIAFLNPIAFFFCHNADILIITKSINWNRGRSQVSESYRDCKLYLIKCSLFISIFCCCRCCWYFHSS